MQQILIETGSITDIPVLTAAPAGGKHLPLILWVTGYGGRKEDALPFAQRCASRGFFFLSFDALYHGERYHPQLDHSADPEMGGVYPPDTGLDTGITFFRVISHCLKDACTLLSHYAADRRIDATRCGVSGMSMGGYAACLIFSRLPQFNAAVPMVGIPCFHRRWSDLLDECSFSNPEWAGKLAGVGSITAEHTRFIESIDPLPGLRQAAPRALFLMNNDFDCDQPKHYSIETYRELLPYYAGNPMNLRLGIYPAGHTVTGQMEQDALDWFAAHL